MPVLDPPIDGESVFVVPPIIAGFGGPVPEVVAVSGARTIPLMLVPPPRALPIACVIERPFTLGLGSARLGTEVPVEFAALIKKSAFGDENAGVQVLSACLQQKNLRIGSLRETSSDDGARRPGADDNVVVRCAKCSTTIVLVRGYRKELACRFVHLLSGQAQVRGLLNEARTGDDAVEQSSLQQSELNAFRST